MPFVDFLANLPFAAFPGKAREQVGNVFEEILMPAARLTPGLRNASPIDLAGAHPECGATNCS